MRASARRRYVLVVLLVILAFNSVDRLALGLVLEDIKRDLSLSDTQLGVLGGIAFALFYSVMGIPLARWADRGNRIAIIASTTALWSGAVALCGAASSFLHLLLIRIGVAVGEAGCVPPAHSLIADLFDRAERPRAMAIYMLGAPLSMVIGYFLAGWLNEFHGWRAMFLILGLPGMLLGLLAWFTLNEPRLARGANVVASALGQSSPAVSPEQPLLKDVCRHLWGTRTFRHLLLCYGISSLFAWGVMQWQPTYFVRSFGFSTGELGSWLAAIHGLGGLLGTYWGGSWASRRAAGNEQVQLKAMAAVYCVFGTVSTLIYLSPHAYLALAAMALTVIAGATVSGPLFATIQTLVPERMRATSIAFVYLFANLVGMGFGPLVAGAMSDALRPIAGEESLRYALLALCPGYLWGAWHLLRASKTVSDDLAGVSSRSEASLRSSVHVGS